MSSTSLIPGPFQEPALAAARALSELDQILIAAHVNLDGDAMGSICACGWIYQRLGRECVLYSSTGIPANLKFLPLPAPVISDLAELPFEPQAALYLDCSDAPRLGKQLGERAGDWPSVNIDHHLCEHGLGSLCNFIEPDAAATSQLVAYTALSMGLPLDGELADSIALGLITDTGGFCHGNTSAAVFTLCAQLMRNGCPISAIREKLQSNWSFGRVRLWGRMLSRVKLESRGRVALCLVSQKDLREFHCGMEDLEGLVEWFRKIRGVLVAALIKEEAPRECKFSLRSFGDIDVQAMASELGGGGHKNAAGGNIHDSLDRASEILLKTIEAGLPR